jgi:hypothetical protein
MTGGCAVRLVACSAILMATASIGCASKPPSDDQIWHESTLRPGLVSPETQGERELLVRLSDVPVGQPVTFGSQVFIADAPYAAASGRTCRSVMLRPTEADGTVQVKLACEVAEGWAFVPDPFADASARAASARGQP